MNKLTRKPGRSTALMLALGIIGALAVFVAVAVQPGVTQAQADPCDGPFAPFLSQCQDGTLPPQPPTTPDPGDGTVVPDPTGDMITDSSTSASAAVELKLTIDSMPMNAVAGTSVELYLEDDFQVPDSIARDTVYFTVATNNANQGGGGRVYATDPVEINDGDWYGGDDDWSIQVLIPDMNDAENSGYNGPTMGQTVTMVITKAAGIKNPSEEGSHSLDYKVLGPNDPPDKAPPDRDADKAGNQPLTEVRVESKISLSDEDNKRGYSLTVTGSGFNNGTSAGVYVLNRAPMGDTGLAMCQDIVRNGANVGSAEVGSDDKVAVTFDVTVPTFMAGTENYICAVDGEGRASKTDIEQFHLEPSIRVVPSTVAAGDVVNVFADDYPTTGAAFEGILLANEAVMATSSTSIGGDHSGSATFEVPGGHKGTLRVDGTWGGVKKDAKITIAPSVLNLSKEEVAPNESITIRGSGFGDGSGCLVSATISGAPLRLISDDDPTIPSTLGAGQSCIEVEVSSGGQFAATVAVWADDDSGSNPALTAGIHTIEVVDDEGFTATATVTIKEPTLTVTPDVAGPRDYITISGENWPVENDDGGRIDEVVIDINSGADDEDADPDASGRWSVTYRVAGDITIPSTVPIKASYGDGNIVEVGSFSVPQANLIVEPMRAIPGDTITLTATGFPLFESDIRVKIGSLTVNVPDSAHTDRDGALEGLEVLVPSLDPALYTVQLTVDQTVTIGELTVMDDSLSGAVTELPEAVSDLGDNLNAIFHFNNASKAWTFFDPRPEFAELNTLTEMVGGQPYWVLVGETQSDVEWNTGRTDFTCAASDCWNLKIW